MKHPALGLAAPGPWPCCIQLLALLHPSPGPRPCTALPFSTAVLSVSSDAGREFARLARTMLT